MRFLFGVILAVALVPVAAFAQKATLPKAEVEAIVREYILNNPEIIMESVQRLHLKEQAAQLEKTTKVLNEKQGALITGANLPQAGNPKGDVTLVEFFDYNCGYCKRMIPVVTQLLKDDKNLRVVFRELPILHESSTLASKAALAVNRLAPAKYIAYHSALMTHTGEYNEAFLIAEATKLGLDAAKLKVEMANPAIQVQIDADKKLAEELGIQGTPAFIVGKDVIPGATSLDTLKQKIAALRSKPAK